MKKNEKYKQDGVNIQEGDSFSAFAKRVCESTYKNSHFVYVKDMTEGNFRGPRGFQLKALPKGCIQTIAPDGIGTKVVLIDAAQTYENAARDVFAMTAMDITRWGGLPLVFSSVLDVSTLGEKEDLTNDAARKVIWGMKATAVETNTVVISGETAELGLCVHSENPNANLKFNWSGFMVGVYHPKKMILGNTLEPGQIIMALKENGFRSNGISSVRKAFKMHYGEKWWANPKAKKDLNAACTSSILYDRFFANLNGWFRTRYKPLMPIHLIVHLSGGAFQSKFAEDILFRKNFSATIDNLYDAPEIMQKCAKWRGMTEEECYSTWNGGQGAIVVIEKKDERLFIDTAILYGLQAKKCGEITFSKRSGSAVHIESKFGTGKTITFKPKEK